MPRFKVALVEVDAPEMPVWVSEEIVGRNIEFVIHECRNSDELSVYAGDADVVWVFGGSHAITGENVGLLRRCGAIIRTGSGTDNIPVEEATRQGIIVANTPEAINDAVSDHAIALLFALVRQVASNDRAVRAGIWEPRRIWPNWHVSGQTLGLVGFGNIGRSVAKKLSGFGMQLLVHDPYIEVSELLRYGASADTLQGVLSRSDFVSIHCPLTKDTHHLIGEGELRLMKPSSLLINTSRGPVIEEPALVRALSEGWIAGAALDVLDEEPPATDHPLFKLENVVLTPHIAGFSDQFWHNMWRFSVDTVIDLAEGRWPQSYVNRQVRPRWALIGREPKPATNGV